MIMMNLLESCNLSTLLRSFELGVHEAIENCWFKPGRWG